MAKTTAWGFGLMLVGVALGVLVTRAGGLVCVVAGMAMTLWSLFRSPRLQSLKQRTLRLANDLLEFGDKRGPEPSNPLSYEGSDQTEQGRISNAHFEWKRSTYFNYMAHFRDRVVEIYYELAAAHIFTGLDYREIDPQATFEVDVKRIAEALLRTASQMPSSARTQGVGSDKSRP